MATEGEIAASRTHGKRRRSCLLSCFGASLTSDMMEAKASVSSLQPRRWKFREKKTVPVNVAADVTPTRGEEEAPPAVTTRDVPTEKSKPVQSSFFHWFQKHRDKGSKAPISTNDNNYYQPQYPPAGADPNPEAQNSRVHHITSKCKARAEPAPLHRMQDRTQTGTRTSHPGSPEHSRRATTSTRIPRSSLHKKPSMESAAAAGTGEFDSVLGLSVIAVVLVLLLLCGRACTIVCVCAWFYFSSRLKAVTSVAAKAKEARNGGKDEGPIDMSWKEYKKMVVLRGLLERDRR